MVRLLKQFLSNEKGQALPIVLAVLAIGGLTIAVSLNYATTSLKGSEIVKEKKEGIYAAGAGVEYALWSLKNGIWSIEDGESLSAQLSENISGMAVSMETLGLGTYTMYFSELTTPRDQYWKLTVDGAISWVEDNRYEYVITVTCTVDQTIHLEEVGARIPVGYHYEDGSTIRSDIESPPPAHDPEIIQDDQGAELLNWLWKDWPGEVCPALNGEGDQYTQTFYITGTGSLGGTYAWVEGDPSIIGIVGEITGTRYRITATATRPEDGRTAAEIVASIIVVGEDIQIISWQITK